MALAAAKRAGRPRRRWRRLPAALFAVLVVALAGCAPGPRAAAPGAPATIRVGYFPNITHSQALVGMARGDFQAALGQRGTVEARVFNAGPDVIEAIFGGALDLAYIGPNPAINGYVRSGGAALRVVAGATSGGAALVVRPAANITSFGDLAGKKLATPELANTQDVALRACLAAHGLKTRDKGGTVTVIPTANPQILDLLRQGQIDGAWVPEPWATRLVVEGGGQLFLDERDLWPNRKFASAEVIVSTPFLKAHPDLVKAWLQAHVAITRWELGHPQEAQQIANTEIKRLTGKALAPAELDQAWSRLNVTYDPLPATVNQMAANAYAAGFLPAAPQLDGLFDLALLNQVLAEQQLPGVR